MFIYFQKHSLSCQNTGFPCPELYNPADFFLDVVSMDYRTPEVEADSRERVKQLAATFSEQPAMDDHRVRRLGLASLWTVETMYDSDLPCWQMECTSRMI